MTKIKKLLPASARAVLLASLISAVTASAAWAEEESGPAFAPPVTKAASFETGPGMGKSSGCVVVLDPGHGKVDGHYSGCSFEYNGITYHEDEINMKIALYTKQYLEQNSRYTVYLTKNSPEEYLSLEQRASFAASVHADLFVSQHVDSAPGNGSITNAYGVSALPPRIGR